MMEKQSVSLSLGSLKEEAAHIGDPMKKVQNCLSVDP